MTVHAACLEIEYQRHEHIRIFRIDEGLLETLRRIAPDVVDNAFRTIVPFEVGLSVAAVSCVRPT